MNTFTSPCIDPRTGLIRFQLPLLHLIGNDHMGPALSLMLDYLPLETQVCGQRRRGRTSTQWAYYCDDALALADQSARYALAQEKRVTWDENGPAPQYLPRYRCEVSRYKYDNVGNLIQRVYPDGSSERITYYSPAGEEHCPAEPQGFIRFIKSVTHCRGGGDPATGRTVFYRYRGFPGRSGSPLAGRQMILCIAGEVPGRLLQRFDYHMQPDGGNNEHGRLIKKPIPTARRIPRTRLAKPTAGAKGFPQAKTTPMRSYSGKRSYAIWTMLRRSPPLGYGVMPAMRCCHLPMPTATRPAITMSRRVI